MKKLFMFLLGLTSTIVMSAQECKINAVMVEPEFKTGYLDFSDKSVSFTFFYSSYNGEIEVSVFNKTNERMYIEWENARYDNSRVVFGDDTGFSMRNAKQDEAVPAYKMSIERGIYPESWFTKYNFIPIEKSRLTMFGGQFCNISIPIRFDSGQVKYYRFKIHVYCFNPVDCSGVKVGMKAKEVKKMIGEPNYISKGYSRNETWYYSSNVTLKIQKGVVVGIEEKEKYPYMYE